MDYNVPYEYKTEAHQRKQVQGVLDYLREKFLWIESYKLGAFDCSTQSTTLWYILKDKGIKSRIVSSIYFDNEKHKWEDHIFLMVTLDKMELMVDATFLEIRNADPRTYGYIILHSYDSPDEANKKYPGEYVPMKVIKR